MTIEPKGYSFVNDLDGDKPLHPSDCLPPLTIVEIARLNEAFARTKLAIELARDFTAKLIGKDTLSAPFTQEQQLYVDYFGVFDQTRAKTVRNNFQKLFIAFDNQPEVVDHRNTDFGRDCFAATHTKNLQQGDKVRIWIGRDFFVEGKARPRGTSKEAYQQVYSNTSDATVGTLIHEFSHGVFHAVDAPPVNTDDNWQLNPDMNPGDNYGASPDNNFQSSTRELDKRLAKKDPTISLRNADNYGQFACELLILKGK